jgi:7-cyano-7-deazaguanine synthase
LLFDYGQRHRKELGFAVRAARALGAPRDVIDIAGVGARLSGSALTDAAEVPDGHSAEETMRITVVPNRNAIMMTIAFGLAAGGKLDAVALAMHGGDHFIYPDCRPAFVEAFRVMQEKALDGKWQVARRQVAGRARGAVPASSKAGIVAEGARLGVPFADTWSCYKGGDAHCGRCGTCVERRKASTLPPSPTRRSTPMRSSGRPRSSADADPIPRQCRQVLECSMAGLGEGQIVEPFEAATLASPLLRRFYSHWLAKRGDRPMPSFDDLDPLEFPWALGSLTLVDVLREPLRFRYRLVGGAHVKRLGVDMTGKFAEEFPSVAVRQIVVRSYTETVETARPTHRTRWDVVAGVNHHYEALILPLASTPPTVDMLAICAEYLDRRNLK